MLVNVNEKVSLFLQPVSNNNLIGTSVLIEKLNVEDGETYSHMLEHLVLSSSDIKEFTLAKGIILNGFVTSEYIAFNFLSSRDHIIDIYKLIQMILRLTFTGKFHTQDLKREKEIVNIEIKQRMNNMHQINIAKFEEIIFGTKSDPITGNQLAVNGLDLVKIRQYQAELSKKSRCIISLNGDVQEKFDRAPLVELLSSYEGVENFKKRKTIKSGYKPIVFKNSPNVHLFLNFSLPIRNLFDRVLLQFIEYYMAGGPHSILYSELKEKWPVTYQINSDTYFYSSIGILTFSLTCAEDNYLDILNKLESDLLKLYDEKIWTKTKYTMQIYHRLNLGNCLEWSKKIAEEVLHLNETSYSYFESLVNTIDIEDYLSLTNFYSHL